MHLGRGAVRPLRGQLRSALEQFGEADLIHDNGVWLPHNHQLANLSGKAGIPRMVSVRGMLEPWALQHKQLKKKLAWWLYQRRDLRRSSYLHATGETEALNLRRLGLGVPVVTIANGIDLPKPSSKSSLDPNRRSGAPTALFMGRIYPVKGLPMLVQAWARARPQGWRLIIAGPDEAGHRAEVERACTRSQAARSGVFHRRRSGPGKEDLFANADLFILPRHSESFGIAVAEALAHGLPVLTTKGTPWPGVVERNCGWWVEPTVAGLSEGLRRATSEAPEVAEGDGRARTRVGAVNSRGGPSPQASSPHTKRCFRAIPRRPI